MPQKVSKIDKTEPPPTKHLSETQLEDVVIGTSTLIGLCGLEKVDCHTQVCFVNLISSWVVEFINYLQNNQRFISKNEYSIMAYKNFKSL